jgi:hypothetical protein
MFKRYRDYISVLTREFYVYYGVCLGLLIGIGIPLTRPWRDDKGVSGELWFIGAVFVAVFVVSRAVLLAAAYVVRRRLGPKAKPAISKKLQAQDKVTSRKYRLFAFGYLAFLILAKILRQHQWVSEEQYAWIITGLVCAFLIWIAVQSFRRRDEKNLEKGSAAAIISWGSRYVLVALVIIFIAEQLWAAYLLKRFPFN